MSTALTTLERFAAKTATTHEVMRALATHPAYFVPLGFAPTLGRSEFERIVMLSTKGGPPAGELYVFTDESCLDLVAKQPLGSFVTPVSGIELFCALEEQVGKWKVNPGGGLEHFGFVPNVRVEVVDDHGQPVPPGEQGEIRVFSDRQSEGYLGDPDATARAFRDGGFYPGDLGRLLPDGMLLVDGRVDDRMDLGGMKFLPELLEEVAFAYPGVKDAAAYAAPDAAGLDVCWLAVASAGDLDRQGLADHIARSGRGLPEVRFAWIDTIPRNAMGKAERRRLREETISVLTAR